jgi:hypothetical protein
MLKRSALVSALTVAMVLSTIGVASASSTAVPGHQDRFDADNNGYSDAGVYVTGSYTSLYAYDAGSDWYWDLGDGRVQGTVGSVDDLDQETLTTCHYRNVYRADFGNDPYMDAGWIINNINCKGVEKATYTYLIVHETDPRYTGNPDWAVWGDWEYHVLTQSGQGNLVERLVGA